MSSRIFSRRRIASSAPCPVAASIRRTPAATPDSASSLKSPISPVRLDVRAAAQLDREIAHPHHAHEVAVLVAEERERAGLERVVVGHLLDGDVGVLADARVDFLFDRRQVAVADRTLMAKSKRRRSGVDQRARLMDLRAERRRAARSAGCGSRNDCSIAASRRSRSTASLTRAPRSKSPASPRRMPPRWRIEPSCLARVENFERARQTRFRSRRGRRPGRRLRDRRAFRR